MNYVCTTSPALGIWGFNDDGTLKVPNPVPPPEEGEWVLSVAPAIIERNGHNYVLWTWVELGTVVEVSKDAAKKFDHAAVPPGVEVVSGDEERCAMTTHDYQCQKAAGHEGAHFNVAYGAFEGGTISDVDFAVLTPSEPDQN